MGKLKYCPVPACEGQGFEGTLRKHWRKVHVSDYLRIMCPAPDCDFECDFFKEMAKHMKSRHKTIFPSVIEAMYYFIEFQHIAEIHPNADFVDAGDLYPSALTPHDATVGSLFPKSLYDNPENQAVVHSVFNQFATYNTEFMIFESCKSYQAKITHLRKVKHSLADCDDDEAYLPEPKAQKGPADTRHHAYKTVQNLFNLYCRGLPQQAYGQHAVAAPEGSLTTAGDSSVSEQSNITEFTAHTTTDQPEYGQQEESKSTTNVSAGTSSDSSATERLANIKAKEAELLSQLSVIKGGGGNKGNNQQSGNKGNQGSNNNRGNQGRGGGFKNNPDRNQGGNWGNNQNFNYGGSGRGRGYGGGPMRGGNYSNRPSGPYGGGYGGRGRGNYGRGNYGGGNHGSGNYGGSNYGGGNYGGGNYGCRY